MSNDQDKDLKDLEKELMLIERNLELLDLIYKKKATRTPTRKTNHEERFPIGSPVKFAGPKVNPSLRNRKAVVIGHTPKFVKVSREGKDYRRAPENLTPSR